MTGPALALAALLLGGAARAADEDDPYRRFGRPAEGGEEEREEPGGEEAGDGADEAAGDGDEAGGDEAAGAGDGAGGGEASAPPGAIPVGAEPAVPEGVEPAVPEGVEPPPRVIEAGPEPVVLSRGPRRTGEGGERIATLADDGLPDQTVLLSVLHPFLGVFQASLERRFRPRWSAVGIVGGGRPGGFGALDLGAQVRWYAWGRFDRGASVGVEYGVRVRWAEIDGTRIRGAVHGLGPLVGAKAALGPGFTVDAQLGLAWFSAPVRAWTVDATGELRSAATRSAAVGPLLNLGSGWTF